MANDNIKRCNFCGKPETKVKYVFSADNNHICDECVTLCSNILMQQMDMKNTDLKAELDYESGVSLHTPKEIKEVLDQYIIGQDQAKISLAVAVYNHYKRIMALDEAEEDSV